MLTFKSGDIFNEPAEALVNPVNCVGVMGRGLALEFRQRFPGNYAEYRRACREGRVRPGRMLVHHENGRCIINFPTKRHWRDDSRIEDLREGLKSLTQELRNRGIRSVAIPALGAGLGGLEWPAVRAEIEAGLGSLTDVDVIVLEPQGREK